MWPVPTVFMPPLDTRKDVLALCLLATVTHKLHIPVVYRPRGSLKGFWSTSAPGRVLVVVGNEGIAMSYNAGGGSVVDIHGKSLHCCVVLLKLPLQRFRLTMICCGALTVLHTAGYCFRHPQSKAPLLFLAATGAVRCCMYTWHKGLHS